jgi:hypothetical protein
VALTVTEVTPELAAQHLDAIHDFAKSVETSWRCNSRAVAEGNLLATYPTREALAHHVNDPESYVAVYLDGLTIYGAIVVADDEGKKRGGGHIKWLVGASVGSLAAKRTGFLALINAATARYGWVWGRIGHDAIREMILNADPSIREAGDDPMVLVNGPLR